MNTMTRNCHHCLGPHYRVGGQSAYEVAGWRGVGKGLGDTETGRVEQRQRQGMY